MLRKSPVISFAVLALLPALGWAAPRPAVRAANPDWLSSGVYGALQADDAALLPAAHADALPSSAPDKGTPAARLAPSVLPNVLIGPDPSALPADRRQQAEPHVTRSPVNPNILLATFQEGRLTDGGAASCGYAVSLDGGRTWRRDLIPGLTQVSNGPYFRATDPVAAIGRNGVMYLNTLNARNDDFSLANISVVRSTDNGVTWSAPSVVYTAPNAQIFPDKNWMTINNHVGSPTFNRIAVTYTMFTSNSAGAATGNHLAVSYSDDGGQTWEGPFEITPPGSANQATQPVFLPDGSLLVPYIRFTSPNTLAFQVLAKRSANGGRTWTATETLIDTVPFTWDDPALRDGIFLISAATASSTGQTYVAWSESNYGSARIRLSRSDDNGASWLSPRFVNLDTPAGVSAFNPTVAVSDDGEVDSVSWMDKRNAAGDPHLIDVFAATSTDEGLTWGPAVRLSDRTTDVSLAQNTSRGYMIGDYFGLVAGRTPSTPTVAVWVDTRDGEADPVTSRFDPLFREDYAAWSRVHLAGVVANLSIQGAEEADPDGDGFGNLFEYAYGLDPWQRDGGSAYGITADTETVFVSEPTFAGTTAPAGRWVYSTDRSTWQPTATQPAIDTTAGTTPLIRPSGSPLYFRRQFESSSAAYLDAPETLVVGGNARLLNLSTRGFAGTGDAQLQTGFVSAGGDIGALVRVAGPALADLDVPDTLPDPRFTMSPAIATPNPVYDNWGTEPSASAALFSSVGAFAWTEGSRDAAAALTLPARANTALVSGPGNTTGVVLAELYALPAGPSTPGYLTNLSTRGRISGEASIMVGGFVLDGDSPRRCLIRGIGPELANYGVSAGVADPALELFQGGTSVVIASNDDWMVSPLPAAIAAAANDVGAFPLTANSRDAVLIVTLDPGIYTAIMSGVDDSTGIGLLEIYLLD